MAVARSSFYDVANPDPVDDKAMMGPTVSTHNSS